MKLDVETIECMHWADLPYRPLLGLVDLGFNLKMMQLIVAQVPVDVLSPVQRCVSSPVCCCASSLKGVMGIGEADLARNRNYSHGPWLKAQLRYHIAL